MAKTAKVQTFHDKPWKHIIAAVLAFLLAYVAVSWGIDSGRLTAYFIAIVLGVLGLRQVAQAVKKVHAR